MFLSRGILFDSPACHFDSLRWVLNLAKTPPNTGFSSFFENQRSKILALFDVFSAAFEGGQDDNKLTLLVKIFFDDHIFLEIVLVPTIIVLYDLDIPLIDLILLSMLVILAISLIGTLFSAIAIKTKTKEVMLPILMLPILTPVLIAAVETTSALIVGQTISDTQKWVSLIVVFDAIFLVLSPFLFTLIVSE